MYNGFTIEEVRELVKADIMSLREYALFFHMNFSTLAAIRQRVGVKKQELERWTPVQVKWLRKLYTWMGDYEIALLFEEAYPKDKGWTNKHIEKKRQYLGLKRTRAQIKTIYKRNFDFGLYSDNLNRLHQQRKAPTGTIRVWGGREYIRTEVGNETLARYLWEQVYGPIQKGMNVVRKNSALPVAIENLECISNKELAQRNSFHRYPLELKRAIRTLNKLNRSIHEKQDIRPA